MKRSIHIALALMVISISWMACRKETKQIEAEAPFNPFDTINQGSTGPQLKVDSNTLLGLHTYIFSTTCAVPGCHDGHFEPDFRTIQSSYNSLVYATPLKNTPTNDFVYRVDPGNAAGSWLHERVVTDDAVLGRMPLYDTLSTSEVKAIWEWINNGAKDLFGNSPMIPTVRPTFFGMLAYQNDTSGMRLDSVRATIIDPIVLPQQSMVQLWFGLYDQGADGSFLPGYDFTYNKIRFSTDPYVYSGPEYDLNVEDLLSPFMGPIPFGTPGQLGPYFHHFTIDTRDFNIGQTNYVRVYVQDQDHNDPTEIPTQDSPIYFMTYFSFVVQ